jgi:uncharacterized coiled-coil protein SlyX
MTLKDLEERVIKLEEQCARYDERIDELKADNQELKCHLDKQDEGQEQFKESMFDKMNAQRSLIITTLVGVLAAIVGSVVFVAVSRLW